ncbi:hypothetical protein HC762_01195 [bacterium]|nr:hypothetical protein [bacterium]
MDVKSCFDSIPQQEVMLMLRGLLSESRYQIGKHAELKSVEGTRPTYNSERPSVRFPFTGRPSQGGSGLSDSVLDVVAQMKSRTVFVDLGDLRHWDARSLLKLLQEHLEQNVVKIDKRFFRKRLGIPQGSVLSSLLCNFFYGEFEKNCLAFLQPGESLLLRLIDDFLLVTTNQGHARRFARVMLEGNPKYGIVVNAQKSLSNFAININRVKIPRLQGEEKLPYCGIAIDVKSLEVSKFRGTKDPTVANGLTIELSRRLGERFHRKVLHSLKLQMTTLLLDTNLNSEYRVLSNLYQIFMEAGMKMYRYVRGLPKKKRPNEGMVTETWKGLASLATKMTRGKRRSRSVEEYLCSISPTQMNWLAAAGLEHVMARKQTGYQTVLKWARGVMGQCEGGMKMDSRKLQEMREQGERDFRRYRY